MRLLVAFLVASCVAASVNTFKTHHSSLPSTLRASTDPLPTSSYYSLVAQPASWYNISSFGITAPTYDQSIQLPFAFSFFGHQHNYIYINSAGFITMYPQNCGGFCNWNPKSTYDRYIAPFMTDFCSPSPQCPQSKVQYYTDNTVGGLTVQWTNMVLHADSYSAFDPTKAFTFQLQLFSNGTLLFNYLQIPFNPETTVTMLSMTSSPYSSAPGGTSATYPVVVGMGDSVTRTVGSLSFIVKYSSVSIPLSYPFNLLSVASYTLPTCRSYTDCASCLAFGQSSGLDCGWCSASSVCTDGLGPEISEIATTCSSVSALVFTCPVDCGVDGCAVLDSGGDADYGAIAIGACMAGALCVAGMILYIRKKKREHQNFDFATYDAEVHPSKYRSNRGKSSVLKSPVSQRESDDLDS